MIVGRARLQPRTPDGVAAMSDSDGSAQRDDRHRRQSRFCSPVSRGCAGEIPADREEQRLAEAAVAVWPRAGQPQAAPSNLELLGPEPVPAGEAAPAAEDAGGAPDAPPDRPHGAATAAPGRSRRSPRYAAGRAGPARRGPMSLRRASLQGPPRPQRRAGRAPSTASTRSPATPT